MSEVLVLGGGLAGAGAASLLAGKGMRVRVLEREHGPHDKICGEFLSIEARRDLERIGLDVVKLGAMPIDRVRLVLGEKEAEAPLPFTALGLSRRILDEALLELAAERGARIERGVRVNRIAGRTVSTNQGDCDAQRILLATGKHDVRGARRSETGQTGKYVGFKMHWRIDPRTDSQLSRTIELVVFEGGYAGIQLVAPETMNLCLIVQRDRFSISGGNWDALVASLEREAGLARRLEDAKPLFAKPLTVADLPYGYVCQPDGSGEEAVYRLGDQAAMTASLTGDGMAIALRSAIVASECLAQDAPPSAYHRHIAKEVTRQVRRAMMLQRVAEIPALVKFAMPFLRRSPRLLGGAAAATRLPA